MCESVGSLFSLHLLFFPSVPLQENVVEVVHSELSYVLCFLLVCVKG